ncbi:hypothetical protein PIB30_098164 [Stylosanthes scabra]|uniref:RRM domain-containing protein n=1 Tax=Stylosanthes scabra TaxID=79078 RepID=A0ABU6VYD9_9FABA|nr:hypothetical protein [Stylosanthes scabra]
MDSYERERLIQSRTGSRHGHGRVDQNTRVAQNDTNRRWEDMERRSHSIFVDNLPTEVRKETLRRIFEREGNVVDVFISRKRRRANPSIFAFVRFNAKEGAVRAVQNLDGVFVGTRRMLEGGGEQMRGSGLESGDEVKGKGKEKVESGSNSKQGEGKKVIEVEESEPLKKVLGRSIVAESVETIKLRWVIEQIIKGEMSRSWQRGGKGHGAP